MLKVTKRATKLNTKPERIEALNDVFEDCIRYVNERIIKQIYQREGTSGSEDLEAVFNLCSSVFITSLSFNPIIESIQINDDRTIEFRKEVLTQFLEAFLIRFRESYTEIIVENVKDHVKH